MKPVAKPRILIVDDFQDALEMYADYLRFVGFEVLTAETAERGIQLAVEEQPDLILMDIGLPQLSGTDAIRRLKSAPVTAAIPVLILTAHVMKDHRVRGEKAGAEGFIAKPCLPDELVRHVCRALHLAAPPQAH
jgi:two-component system cell cycle response regulator DivK